MPVCAQAQKQSAAKVTKRDAQKVVRIISGDKAKTQTYCDMVKLGEQIEQANDKKDNKSVEELSKKLGELGPKLGPEYAALMDGLQDIDPEPRRVRRSSRHWRRSTSCVLGNKSRLSAN